MEIQEFSKVQDTLFIPLTARILISQRFPEYFYDKRAMNLSYLQQIKKINNKSSEYFPIASLARYFNMNRYAIDFLKLPT